MIVVTIPAQTYKLTTFDAVNTAMGGILDNSQKGQIDFFIGIASQQVNDFCDRVFARETVAETLAGDGGQFLILGRKQIVSVSEIIYDGDSLNPVVDFSVDNAGAGFLFRDSGWTASNDAKWKVTYEAGYILPSFVDAGEPDLPETIAWATIRLVQIYFAEQAENPRIKQARVGDISYTYDPAPIPLSIQTLLGPYVRHTF